MTADESIGTVVFTVGLGILALTVSGTLIMCIGAVIFAIGSMMRRSGT